MGRAPAAIEASMGVLSTEADLANKVVLFLVQVLGRKDTTGDGTSANAKLLEELQQASGFAQGSSDGPHSIVRGVSETNTVNVVRNDSLVFQDFVDWGLVP